MDFTELIQWIVYTVLENVNLENVIGSAIGAVIVAIITGTISYPDIRNFINRLQDSKFFKYASVIFVLTIAIPTVYAVTYPQM